LTARVTFRDADGEVWPWELAEIPVTLQLFEQQVTSRPQEQPVMAPVREEKAQMPLTLPILLCVLLAAGMLLLYRQFYRK
jgi:hypothetical protein